MRITRLDLLRYGKFTDARLALPGAAQDFHLIVGPNEAGKSTLRSAIQDLLFGIETRSRYSFLHGYNEMRLGALIEQGDSSLDFIRSKARSKTLQTADGAALPDSALTPYLGQIERSFFDQMFGLNHERLVKGGQEILSASNDVGQILFQAASGIGSLGSIRDQLEQEADGLWAPRRSDKRAYYMAASELEQAEAALKQATVRTKDWQDASSAVASMTDKLKAARESYGKLDQERVQLERVRRIAPMLSTLGMIERQWAELGTVIVLPVNAAEQLEQAEHEAAIANTSLILFQAQTTELSEKIAALHADQSFLACSADIEALAATRQQLRNFETDIAKREVEIRLLWQDVREAALQLGWPLETEEALGKRLPGSLVRSTMDSLVRRHEALAQALSAAQEALRSREEEIKTIDAEIGLLPDTDIPVALIDALARARSLGDVAAQEKRLETQIGRLQRDLEAAELELGSWSPGLDSLRRLLPPTQDETNALIKLNADLALTAATTCERSADTLAEIEALQMEIAHYKAAHQPVTLDDVTQGRSQRDTTWQAIKLGTLTLVAAAPGYEQAVAEADGLSDKRHDKAQEASELQGRLDHLQRLQQQRAELSSREQANALQLAQFAQSWKERVSSVGLPGLPLLSMSEWRTARERVLSAAGALAEAQSVQKDAALTVADTQADLLLALQATQPDAHKLKLSALILLADGLVTAATRAQERRNTLATQKRRAAVAMPELSNRVAQAQTALTAWQADLDKNLALAHLPPDTQIGTVTAALAQFEHMHQQLQKIRETRGTRIDMMRRDLDNFATVAQAIAADIAPDLAAESATHISLGLDAQLKQHAAAAQELARLKSELDKATAQANTASAKIAAAKASLEPLLRLSGTTNNDELRGAAVNSDRLRSLTTEMDQAVKLLLNAGDGLDREELASEFAATDANAIASSLADIKRQTDEVVAQQNSLSGALTSAEAVLQQIAGQGEAARAESQRQEALAKMANALERYIKVFTAAKLLRWSIEKFRETKQGPMLARASEVFMGLTQAAFSKLVVDYESEPLKLSGQRATGEMVEIEGMSEGTRDQLYLALRLAALELHLEQTVALPFIADDLFINYDDGRAKSGLQALAKLSESTQVIFLSHHEHLVPVAQSVFGDKLNVVRLG